ncbi:aldehyde dehydrogenase [Eremomyces bilateralis CBS 781.70]|uniref:aldehyde dehydrogenase (NAD(+)) n=1 Tax=Eremomyces bilateralis CBS 781.70 TaxID=1392243 RepID=A0A6G1FV55_9PEZI|nr:aldehyde dehydrogenase [Eremomyces bilateralis CBS 781.70]KAF1809620.1 aldehyde dehydrogenase [Eremomyces bilateralis CBS 781.70]
MSPSKVSVDFTKFYNIVDGQKRSAATQHQGINPGTQESLWDVPIGTQQDVDDAVAAAQKAFKSWSATSIEKRTELINKFVEVFAQYTDEMIQLVQKETGKPKQFAAQEVSGVGIWAATTVTHKLPEEKFEDAEKVVTTRYTPLGVVGAICPWNFPVLLAVGKVFAAIFTGNTIIVKPSPFTPYSALKIIEIAQQVFPAGVIQVIGGDDKLGPMLTTHPGIAKISFTGSIATGKKVMEAASKTLKRVTLELGGNDASIILPDVDIEKVAPQVALGAFVNSGQVCVATKRIYIHQDIYKPFVEAMVKFTQSLKVGKTDDEGVLLGPIQNAMQYEKVKGYFEDSKKNGYKFAVGADTVATSEGYFVQPTIIDNPPADSRIHNEEPFGPIVPTQPWTDEEEVIARANNTNTGLGACVWGKDVAHAENIGRRLEAGSVFINSSEKPTPLAFFSGHKESGLGGEFGAAGLLPYCNAHVMHVYK